MAHVPPNARILHFTNVVAPPNVPPDGEAAMNYLFSICGFNPRPRTVLIDEEGLDNIETFSSLRYENLTDLLKARASIPNNRGGMIVSQLAKRRIAGLLYWIREIKSRGGVPDPNQCNINTIIQSLQSLDAKKELAEEAFDAMQMCIVITRVWC